VISDPAGDPQDTIARLRRHAKPLAPIPTSQTARLTPLPDIRAVLFDVYGTLFVSASGDIGVGSTEARALALGGSLNELGIPADSKTARRAAAALVEAVAQAHAHLKKQGREYPEVDIREICLQVLGNLQEEGLISNEPDRGLCEPLAVEYECRINPTWPMPGVAETLGHLRRRKIALGIVSNAQFFTPLLFPAYLDQSLQTLGFDPALCVWSYVHLEAKPSAELFRTPLQVLSRRAIAPARTLYVGNDRINDIWPAARMGLKTALFAGDRRSFRPRTEESRGREEREDILLTELPQLLEVLGPA
jgi:putative hydrolase of the HAD superfamily